MLAVVGVIVKLLLDDIGEMDTCRYCSASLAPRVTICPHCHRASEKGSGRFVRESFSSALRRSVSQSRPPDSATRMIHKTPPPPLPIPPAKMPASHISPDGKYLDCADQAGIHLQLIDTGPCLTDLFKRLRPVHDHPV